MLHVYITAQWMCQNSTGRWKDIFEEIFFFLALSYRHYSVFRCFSISANDDCHINYPSHGNWTSQANHASLANYVSHNNCASLEVMKYISLVCDINDINKIHLSSKVI